MRAKLTLTAAIALALALTLTSCGEHSFEEWLFGESSSSEETSVVLSSSSGGTSSSSSSRLSSSSGVVSSSSEEDGGDGDYTTGVVGPLLQTKWDHHSAPFTNMLPIDGSNRSIAGCVAGATAQIMGYHKHPTQGSGQSEAYTTQSRGFQIPSINFGETNYDWANMLNTYTGNENAQQQNAVATLFYHVAVGMNTDFDARYSSQGGETPLTRFFKYDKNIETLSRSYFNNDAEWEAILKAQLDASLPVIYSGVNSQGGGSHFFVIDGYDNKGMFHINMGYGGRDDGWYSLNNIKYGSQNHSYGQSMTINIKPDQGGTGTNRMALSIFTPSKTAVSQNEQFIVTIQMRGIGYVTTGQAGVALVNNNGDIIEVIGRRSNPERRPSGVTGTWEINCIVPSTVPKGQYKLRIVVRPGNNSDNNEWRIATMSPPDVPTSIPFTVQ
jgi:hypothetical protein